MKRQQEVHLVVKQFAKEVGAPEVFVCDPHPVLCSDWYDTEGLGS